MRRNIFIAICLVFSLLLLGCGGGGGGSSTPASSGGGTTAPVTTDTLTLSTGTINFAATEFEEIPSPIRVTARG